MTIDGQPPTDSTTRRWYFSLRTLLMLQFVVGAVLAVGIVISNRAAARKATLSRLRDYGCVIYFDKAGKDQGRQTVFHRIASVWLGAEGVTPVYALELDCRGQQFDPRVAMALNDLKEVKLAGIVNASGVSCECIQAISEWQELKCLSLIGSELPKDALDVLGKSESIEMLVLDRTNASDDDVDSLCRMKHLSVLRIEGTQISETNLRLIESLLVGVDVYY